MFRIFLSAALNRMGASAPHVHRMADAQDWDVISKPAISFMCIAPATFHPGWPLVAYHREPCFGVLRGMQQRVDRKTMGSCRCR